MSGVRIYEASEVKRDGFNQGEIFYALEDKRVSGSPYYLSPVHGILLAVL